LIAETDIDRVFNADVIGKLAKGIKTPPDAVLALKTMSALRCVITLRNALARTGKPSESRLVIYMMA
jgi:hypothetical protein